MEAFPRESNLNETILAAEPAIPNPKVSFVFSSFRAFVMELAFDHESTKRRKHENINPEQFSG
jgi:hypothetical protein